MSPDPTFAILSHKLEIFLFEEVKKTLIIFFSTPEEVKNMF